MIILPETNRKMTPEEIRYRAIARRWKGEIELYEKEFNDWEDRGTKVCKRYLDERTMTQGMPMEASKFNILWSNTETIMPAAYAKAPKPQVDRRYKDRDPVGRVASLILERCLEFENEQYGDLNSVAKQSLLDRLLPGRGVAWVRYEPTFVNVPIDKEDDPDLDIDEPTASPPEPTTGQVTEDVYEERLQTECSPIDYVHWKDFGHVSSKTWAEVPGVWRVVQMTKDKLKDRFESCCERFGYRLSEIPLDSKPSQLDDRGIQSGALDDFKRACIYEIWDKEKGLAIWLHKNIPVPLDVREDPLELDGFFPCPKPMYSTTGTASLVPVPDYCMYQDQARELDMVTERISMLTKAVKVVGIYDASQDAVKRMLNEGTNNTMIPCDTWAMFAEKGGMKGVVDWLPLDQVIKALAELYVDRESIKQTIYEITGLSDILRGSVNPNEKLGQSEIKAQWGSLRIKNLQQDVARFCRDLTRMRAEVICNLYSDDTILQMAAVETLAVEDQPYVPQALQLLRNDVVRDFRVDIETDTMVEVDENAEKEGAVEFLGATGTFLEKAFPVAQAAPAMTPLLAEMLMFGVRRFKAGRSIEGAFEEAMQQFKAQAMQPKPADPKAEAEKMQAEADMQKTQAEMQIAPVKAQAEMFKAQKGLETAQVQASRPNVVQFPGAV